MVVERWALRDESYICQDAPRDRHYISDPEQDLPYVDRVRVLEDGEVGVTVELVRDAANFLASSGNGPMVGQLRALLPAEVEAPTAEELIAFIERMAGHGCPPSEDEISALLDRADAAKGGV